MGTLRHAKIVELVKYVELQCYSFKFDKLCDLLSVTCDPEHLLVSVKKSVWTCGKIMVWTTRVKKWRRSVM